MGQAGSGQAEANGAGCKPRAESLGPLSLKHEWRGSGKCTPKTFCYSSNLLNLYFYCRVFDLAGLVWTEPAPGLRRPWPGDNVTISALSAFS